MDLRRLLVVAIVLTTVLALPLGCRFGGGEFDDDDDSADDDDADDDDNDDNGDDDFSGDDDDDGFTPPPLASAVSGFDEDRGLMILYGGARSADPADLSSVLWAIGEGDTGFEAFSFSSAGDAPPALTLAAGGYDEDTEQFVVSGGLDNAGIIQGTTRLGAIDFDARTVEWMLISEKGPAPRTGAAAAIGDFGDGPSMLLFGGQNETSLLGDTWLLDIEGATWSQVTTAAVPPARFSAALIHNANNASMGQNRFWMFGGLGDALPLDDMWRFNPQADVPLWVSVGGGVHNTPPSPRFGLMAAMAQSDLRVVFYGGFDVGPLGDMFVLTLDPEFNGWTTVTQGGDSLPGARLYGAFEHDPGEDRFLLYGGAAGDNQVLGDLWVLEEAAGTGVWTQATILQN